MTPGDDTMARVRSIGWRPLWLAMAALFVIALFAMLWQLRPRLTDEEARTLVLGALQRETRESFVVTGALELTVTTRVRNTRRLLPGMLDVNVGSVETTVRAPGRVSYGFPLNELRAEAIQLFGDTIEVVVPSPRVYSVEPELSQLEIETESGWLRLRQSTRDEVQQRAVELVQTTLRAQANQHLRDSAQPRINTASALDDLLRPVLRASGMRDPVFRFIIDRQLIYRTGDR
ncbi:MAG TPA: DUF4230 domain-containing protein [Longimicrobiales bacterium]|nr:DUF4230 domain-containing protein [Longimicrobiales bacterium]